MSSGARPSSSVSSRRLLRSSLKKWDDSFQRHYDAYADGNLLNPFTFCGLFSFARATDVYASVITSSVDDLLSRLSLDAHLDNSSTSIYEDLLSLLRTLYSYFSSFSSEYRLSSSEFDASATFASEEQLHSLVHSGLLSILSSAYDLERPVFSISSSSSNNGNLKLARRRDRRRSRCLARSSCTAPVSSSLTRSKI